MLYKGLVIKFTLVLLLAILQHKTQCQTIKVDTFLILQSDTSCLKMDRLILPNSLTFKEEKIEKKYICSVDQFDLCLLSQDASQKDDTVYIKFEVLDIKFDSVYTYTESLLSPDSKIIGIRPNDYKDPEEKLIRDGLNYGGTFSRGLSIGNSQDLVLNSNLNLNLLGDLGGGTTIKAIISDNNLPLQAEGNTQVLQEFDRVYMEIQKNNTMLRAGDFNEFEQDFYFTKYTKKAKGVSLSTQVSKNSENRFKTKATYSISRGKFNRETLAIQEGNQGPYRLSGGTGGGFYIILSGSEKVYLNGVLLTRGYDQDYIIDYNSAELSFTPKHLINRDSRVIVEYEYADQSYLRSVLILDNTIKLNKWKHRIHFYQEQDSKSVLGSVQLDSTDLQILQEAGDSPERLFRDAIYPTPLADQDDQTNYYSLDQGVLSFQNSQADTLYRSLFSYIGEGEGAYALDNTTNANGRVYEYVGSGQGNYLPVIRLTPPESRRILNYSQNYESKSSSLISELSMSNTDINRFSNLQDSDNTGLAYHLSGNHHWHLKDTLQLLTVFGSGELRHANYRNLNPYRTAEFNRDWNNLEDLTIPTDELYTNVGLQLRDSTVHDLAYGFQTFTRIGLLQASKHLLTYKLNARLTSIESKLDYLTSESSTTSSTFLRPNILVNQFLKSRTGHRFRVEFWHEDNAIQSKEDNILQAPSQRTDYYSIGLYSPRKTALSYSLDYTLREDDMPDGQNFAYAFSSIDYGGSIQYKFNPQNSINLTAKQRTLQVKREDLIPQTNESTILGSLNIISSLFRSSVNLQSFLEYNSGQQAVFEDQYLQVQKGEGIYIWNDINQDSIQQLTEFVQSPIDTADFVKVAVFNNTFITANQQKWNQTVSFDPGRLFTDTTTHVAKGFLSKLFFSSRIKVDQKLEDVNDLSAVFQPVENLIDSSVIFRQSSFDHFVHINRTSNTFDIRIGQKQLLNRRRQVYGVDDFSNGAYYTQLRWNWAKQLDFLLLSELRNKERVIETQEERTVAISSVLVQPTISYRPNNQLRINLILKYIDRENSFESTFGKSLTQDYKLDITWRKGSKSFFQSSISFAKVNYESTVPNNDFVELDMLDGLKDGNNMIWETNWTRKLNKTLELSLNYNGRKTGEDRLVHQGSMQLRAIF